jgi:sulfide:quinone oxidoreductase
MSTSRGGGKIPNYRAAATFFLVLIFLGTIAVPRCWGLTAAPFRGGGVAARVLETDSAANGVSLMQGPVRINDQLSVAGQISPDEIADLAKQGFQTIINNRPDGEEPDQPAAAANQAEAEKKGLRYVYQPVTTSAIGKSDVTAFYHALSRAPTPVLAHCRSGTRCYLLWGLSRVLFEHQSPLAIVAEAAHKGYDLRSLPALAEKLQSEK